MKFLITAATLTLALGSISSAHAVDLTIPIMEPDGKPSFDQFIDNKSASCGEMKDHPCLTLGAAIVHSLLFSYTDEQSLSGEDKFKRGKLAERLVDSKSADLSADEVVMIKKTFAKLYGPWAIIQAYKALDPAAK